MLVPTVLDLPPLREAEPATIDALRRACADTGFLLLAGHGLDAELDGVLAAARAFFDQPPADRERVPRIDRYGYVPHAATAIDRARASRRTEYLDLGMADEVPLPDLDGFEAAVRRYQAGALAAGRVVLGAMALALGIDRDFFDRRLTRPQCRLRLLRYPPVGARPDGTLPVPTGPHTDYGLITLLATDGVPGLEVEPLGGAWMPLDPAPGQLVVNLGDMMARWTNDVFRSTPHRVVGPATGDRISIPFFVNPDPGEVVETIPACVTGGRPARYEPVTAGEFLARRIDGGAAGADEPDVDRAEGPVRGASR